MTPTPSTNPLNPAQIDMVGDERVEGVGVALWGNLTKLEIGDLL